ncbi:MAG TPA: hypothetical protein VM925_17715 [Labilithrix sp.]|nr:hypothetical protein [Labilithrix sp.]
MRVGRKWSIVAAAFVVFVCAAYGASRYDVHRRKANLAKAVAAERALLGDRSRAMVTAMDDVVLEATKSPWAGDARSAELATPEERAALFKRTMLFVRAALPEVARLDAIGGAVRRSEKDTVALCLVKPPPSTAPDDVHAAATRYWLGGALFDDATHDVLPLNIVHKGLRPLSRAFAAELEEADDHLSLRRLEEEHAYRQPLAITLARTAADAELLVVVVDELPEGMAEPEVGKSLTASRRPAILPSIEDSPHYARVLVWSSERREIVLRVRTRVDAKTNPSSRRPVAVAEMHGCQAAVAARGL